MDSLVTDYLPFLKKEIAKYENMGFSYDERLSLAMLVFVNCVKQYDEDKGKFISFLSASVKYRLIDQYRINKKDRRVVSIHGDANSHEDGDDHMTDEISVQRYLKSEEEKGLREEIHAFNEELKEHSLSFSTLKENCPKQKRSRKLCMKLAFEIANDAAMKENFMKSGRLPQTEAAMRTGISVKTVEKYRRYIVALVILLLGDYSSITSFIPFYDDSGNTKGI